MAIGKRDRPDTALPLLDFQRGCLNEIDWFSGRALVALPMGSGKTIIALEWLAKHLEAWPAIIVCPASVKWTWERVARQQIGVQARVLEGMKPDGRKLGKPKLVIVNYDILIRRGRKKTDLTWTDWLMDLKPKTVVIDEAQYLRDGTDAAPRPSKRTKEVRDLCEGVPHVLALSGTPLESRPIELFQTLGIINPTEFNSRWRFGQQYCGAELTPYGWRYKGSSNLDELNKVLSSKCMVRRRKEDILKDLPAKMRSVVPVDMSDRDEYRRAEDDFDAWLYRIDPEAQRRASAAEAMTKIGYLLRLAARLKAPAVIRWVNDWLEQTDGKIGVFAIHHQMIDLLRAGIAGETLLIDGSVTGSRRLAVVDRFRNDPSVRVIVGNVAAMGTGVDGLQVASDCAFAEIDWKPMTQAEDRFHRIGSVGTVRCHYLVAHSTIEEKLCEVVQEKQRVVSTVLDGGIIGEDFDVFDRLMRMLK